MGRSLCKATKVRVHRSVKIISGVVLNVQVYQSKALTKYFSRCQWRRGTNKSYVKVEENIDWMTCRIERESKKVVRHEKEAQRKGMRTRRSEETRYACTPPRHEQSWFLLIPTRPSLHDPDPSWDSRLCSGLSAWRHRKPYNYPEYASAWIWPRT